MCKKNAPEELMAKEESVKKKDEMEDKSALHISLLRILNSSIFIIFSLVGVATMGGLFGAGFNCIGKACIKYFKVQETHPILIRQDVIKEKELLKDNVNGNTKLPLNEKVGKTKEMELVISTLKGLELIFLAPLPFLLVLASWGILSLSLKGPDIDKDISKKLQFFPSLDIVKSSLISLFISVIAVHLLAKLLENNISTWFDFFPHILLIVLLAIYFFMLRRFKH